MKNKSCGVYYLNAVSFVEFYSFSAIIYFDVEV